MGQVERIAPILFLGAGASAAAFEPGTAESYLPTVTQFFSRVNWEERGFKDACADLARWIDVTEKSECTKLRGYDAEKFFNYLELLETADRIWQVDAPMTPGKVMQPRSIITKDLPNFLKSQLVRIYGRDYPQVVDNNYLRLFRLLDERTPSDRPIVAFTTNYDTVLESQINNAQFRGEAFNAVPRLCTGFRPGNPARWDPQAFQDAPTNDGRLVKLFKLHGSVTWKWNSPTGVRVPVEMDYREPLGDKDCVIYFGYKGVPEEEPFKTLHDWLKDTLLNAEALVAIGFRFADPYIRETFDMALRANRQLRVICCLRHEPEPNSPLATLMRAFPNRVVLLGGADQHPVSFGENGFLEALEGALDGTTS